MRRLVRRRPRRRGSTGLRRVRRALHRRRGSDGFKVEDESDVWVPHVSGSRERARNRSQGYYCPFVFQFNCSVSIFNTNDIEGMEN